MKRILVCQHIAHEILGTLDPLFRGSGFRVRYVNFARHPHTQPALDGYNGLIILGGPMNVDEVERHPHLAHEVQLIQEAIQKQIPVLGICLGAQLIAKALGAKVTKNTEKEIGWYDVALTEAGEKDPLLSNFKKVEKIFQWHGDTFDLPEKAVHLASSKLCRHQAFRYGEKVYGFQFHLEVDEAIIVRWLHVNANQEELKSLYGKIDPATIEKETSLYIQRLQTLSLQTFTAFIQLFGIEKKLHRLSSR